MFDGFKMRIWRNFAYRTKSCSQRRGRVRRQHRNRPRNFQNVGRRSRNSDSLHQDSALSVKECGPVRIVKISVSVVEWNRGGGVGPFVIVETDSKEKRFFGFGWGRKSVRIGFATDPENRLRIIRFFFFSLLWLFRPFLLLLLLLMFRGIERCVLLAFWFLPIGFHFYRSSFTELTLQLQKHLVFSASNLSFSEFSRFCWIAKYIIEHEYKECSTIAEMTANKIRFFIQQEKGFPAIHLLAIAILWTLSFLKEKSCLNFKNFKKIFKTYKKLLIYVM